MEDSGDIKTLHADTVAFAHEVGEQDPVVLRQAKRASRITHRASRITMDITMCCRAWRNSSTSSSRCNIRGSD